MNVVTRALVRPVGEGDLFLLVLASLLSEPVQPRDARDASSRVQVAHDREGARTARRLARSVGSRRGEPVRYSDVRRIEGARWRPVRDDEMRSRCNDCAPVGYRFHRSTAVDIDHDGTTDFVEMVTNGQEDALRVVCRAGKSTRILLRSKARRWADQGLFAAGPHGVLVNQPEVNAILLYQLGDALLADFIGD